MKDSRSIHLAVGLAIAAPLLALSSAAQDMPARSITQIKEQLYRARNNLHNSVFLVTDDGIVLTDPINADFSAWLKTEFDARFGVPVRYVLYSHRHADHASGGEVFAETARYIGHENMARALLAEPDPGIVPPEITYSDRMLVTLGGKEVELIYTGVQTHTDDMSIIRFAGERTIYVVDYVSLRRVPGWPVDAGLLDAWLNALRLTEALDYDTVAPAHGIVGTREHVTEMRHYIENLRDQVTAAITTGLTLDEIEQVVDMSAYSDWTRYDALRLSNIEGMYNMLTN